MNSTVIEMYYACSYVSKYIHMVIYTNIYIHAYTYFVGVYQINTSLLKLLFHISLFLVSLELQKLAVIWAFLDLRGTLQTTSL